MLRCHIIVDFVWLTFIMLIKKEEKRQKAEKPREIFYRLLQRMKHFQIIRTKIEMHRAHFIDSF